MENYRGGGKKKLCSAIGGGGGGQNCSYEFIGGGGSFSVSPQNMDKII